MVLYPLSLINWVLDSAKHISCIKATSAFCLVSSFCRLAHFCRLFRPLTFIEISFIGMARLSVKSFCGESTMLGMGKPSLGTLVHIEVWSRVIGSIRSVKMDRCGKSERFIGSWCGIGKEIKRESLLTIRVQCVELLLKIPKQRGFPPVASRNSETVDGKRGLEETVIR